MSGVFFNWLAPHLFFLVFCFVYKTIIGEFMNGPGVSSRASQDSVCFALFILNRYWGIFTVPGSFLKSGDLGWPDPHPAN